MQDRQHKEKFYEKSTDYWPKDLMLVGEETGMIHLFF